MEKDFWGTLSRLGEAGFRNVELAGLGGNSATEVKDGLVSRGLAAHSMHVGLDRVQSDFDGVVQEAHSLGLEHVIVPWLDPKSFLGGWSEIGKVLGELADRMAKHDISFGYHNHAFEFESVGESTGFGMIWDHSGETLRAELDLYWVAKAGENPGEWLRRLGPKVKQAHFKDMALSGEFTEVGSGTLNWRELIPVCREVGVDWAIIENDDPKMDPLESVIQSRNYLIGLGLKD